MKKSFVFLLLCTSIFSSHAANNPAGNPIALWSAMGNCKVEPKPGESSVALAYFQAHPDSIYLRVEKAGVKVYQSKLDQTETLKALRAGTIVELYKAQPTAESVMPQGDFLNSKVEEAFKDKSQQTSVELRTFCNKVEGFYALIQQQQAHTS